jgi:hypothetical protein
MATLFQKLGYSYSDPHGDVTSLSANTIEHLESLPPIIEDWQTQDISDSNVGSYNQNPLGTISTTIATTANLIMNLQSTIEIYDNIGVSSIMANVANAANNLISTMNAFKDHTDRVSGVTSYSDYITEAGSSIASTKPFKDTIKGFSKLLIYLIYQTDGITNTSISYGSQTSLFIGPEANTYSNTLTTYKTTVNSSIYISGPNTKSTLTSTQANTINTGINEMITFFDTRRTHDETFFTNMKTMVSDYQKTRQFSNMGESETALVNNYTGSSKILTRINS